MGGTLVIAGAWLMLSSAYAEDALVAPDARSEAVPDRVFDLLSLHLDLDLDPSRRQVSGTATYKARRFAEGELVLDQVAIDFSKVTVGGSDVEYRLEGNTIIVPVPSSVRVGDEAEIVLHYRATPRKGLHFRQSGGGSPDSFAEVWSQGQEQDNRFWFPTFDHPNERFDYTGEVRAPKGWKVHTNSGHEMPAYLVMLAAGEYDIVGTPDNQVWVPPGTSAAAIARVKDDVPDMRQHMEERTKVKYPWGELRHIYVQRFMYGGMENTAAIINTATVLTGLPVHQTRNRAPSLVAHELAHQWYGDLLTCHSWRDLWLNEGFATFIAADWMAAKRGPDDWARTVKRWYQWSQTEKALAGRFHQGDGHVNHNVYAKGAAVLQMLRVLLGEEQFWSGVQLYTGRHQHQTVQTIDLQRALEEVSGQELGWFFQQWVELPYVPHLTVSRSYNDGRLTVTVRQKTGKDRPVYTLPISVEVGTEGEVIHRRVWLEDDKTQMQFELDQAPLYVAFDPKAGLLADVTYEQEDAAWEAQLDSPSPYAVRVAIDALADTSASDGLSKLLRDESRVPSVRSEAAIALGKQQQTSLLIEQLGTSQELVLQGAVKGLSHGRDVSVIPRLETLGRTHKNPDIRVSALWAVTTLSPSRGADLARVLIKKNMGDFSLANSAARVLGREGGTSDIALLTSSQVRRDVRMLGMTSAARIVGRQPLGSSRDRAAAQVARALEPLLEDLDYRARSTAARLLGDLGDKRSIPYLERLRRVETSAGLADRARESVKSIRSRDDKVVPATPAETEATIKDLQERIDALEKELESWKDRH